ncbi:hypothetical protein MASR1M90_16380 [Desulfovibrionales bacterium]
MRKALFIIFVSSFFLAPAWGSETPAQAIHALQQAIDKNDQIVLEKYLDVSAIIERGVDVFIAEYAAHPPGGDGDPLLEMLSGGLSQHTDTAAYQSMKRLLVQETRKFVLWGVASGHFSGHPSAAPAPDGGLLSALFANASKARKELRDVRCAAPQGTKASATARLYDYGSERAYPVHLGLTRQAEGYWKITSVTNLAELIRMVRQEAEQYTQ